jgi:hypothetical protein
MTFFFIDVAIVALLISGFNLFFNNSSFIYKVAEPQLLPPRYEAIDEQPPQYNND